MLVVFLVLAAAAASGASGSPRDRGVVAADVAVICATPSGISAAVAAARASLPALPRIVLLEPSSLYIGAVATSGIGLRDIGLVDTIGGLAREWALLNGAAYGNKTELVWQPDNYIGEASFRALLAGAPNVELIAGAALSGAPAIKRNATVVESLPVLISGSAATVSARVWIDACALSVWPLLRGGLGLCS